MTNIALIGGSNSQNSINKKLAEFAGGLTGKNSVVMDINNYNLPIYSIDIENNSGIPEPAHQAYNELSKADAIILSLAEHNGLYTVAFKNLMDWMSRIDRNIWHHKPMLLMTTSPGGRGGIGVLEIAQKAFPRFGAQIIETFSLPHFFDNFKDGEIIEQAKLEELKKKVNHFTDKIT